MISKQEEGGKNRKKWEDSTNPKEKNRVRNRGGIESSGLKGKRE